MNRRQKKKLMKRGGFTTYQKYQENLKLWEVFFDLVAKGKIYPSKIQPHNGQVMYNPDEPVVLAFSAYPVAIKNKQLDDLKETVLQDVKVYL
jgi:hypothetical protein